MKLRPRPKLTVNRSVSLRNEELKEYKVYFFFFSCMIIKSYITLLLYDAHFENKITIRSLSHLLSMYKFIKSMVLREILRFVLVQQ